MGMLYVPAYMNVISNITIISQQPQFLRDKDKPFVGGCHLIDLQFAPNFFILFPNSDHLR